MTIMNNLIIVTILLACSFMQAAPQTPVTANTEAPVLLKGDRAAIRDEVNGERMS